MLCSSNSFLNLNPIVSSSINKPLIFRSLRIIKFTVSAKMEQNDAAAAAPPFTFLTRKPYTPPSWASHLNPLPSHAFSLGHLPTPIHKWNLPNLPNNTEVWLKRDDLSGMQLSGNKVRKLEFLMADAVAQGADCIITIGGIQSDHCRATAVAAKYLNLDCYLILRTSKILVDKDPGLTGNLLVERLVGAHIELISKEEYAKIGSVTLTDILKEKLLKEGRRPYVIPVGGSNSLGTWGYIEAIREIEQQLQTVHNKLKFDDIVVACGSGGTIAGLSLGSWLGTLKAKVHAFSVCDDPDYFYDFTQGLLDGLNAGVNSRDIVNVQNAKGLGYAITTSEELKYVKEIAAATGVVLDPVYSGKGAYGMLKDMAENPKKWEGRKILFIHTGGLLGLFDKVDQMAPLVTNWSRMDVHESVPREDGTAVAAAAMGGRYLIRAWQAFKARPVIPRARRFYYGGFEKAMSKREAALILGIREPAVAKKIHEAYLRVIKANHPDAGGSHYLAYKITEAKDVLTGKHMNNCNSAF